MNGFLLWDHLTKESFYKEDKFTCLYEWMLGSIVWVLKLCSLCIFPRDIDYFCNCLLAILINFNFWSTQSYAKLPHIQLIVINMKWLLGYDKFNTSQHCQNMGSQRRTHVLLNMRHNCNISFTWCKKNICSNNLSDYYTTISCWIDNFLSNQHGRRINLFNNKVDIELVYWCQCNSSVDVKFWFKNLMSIQHQQAKALSMAFVANV